jgi:ketosteroid isomerase-like protein
VVIVHPGFQGRSTGRDAAVGSYVAFTSQAKVLAFEEVAEDVDVYGDTAVVSYTFVIAYETGDGRRLQEQGRDLFVLKRENRRWRAVWRTLLPESPAP